MRELDSKDEEMKSRDEEIRTLKKQLLSETKSKGNIAVSVL